jgi:hypothetical protein
MKIELNETQTRLLITIINQAQSNGIKFLMNYESKLITKTPEMDFWYEETKIEFQELNEIKQQLIENENN